MAVASREGINPQEGNSFETLSSWLWQSGRLERASFQTDPLKLALSPRGSGRNHKALRSFHPKKTKIFLLSFNHLADFCTPASHTYNTCCTCAHTTRLSLYLFLGLELLFPSLASLTSFEILTLALSPVSFPSLLIPN